MPHKMYETLVCGMDVTLDPFPFGGGVTMTDSLLCHGGRSVPFVTASVLQVSFPGIFVFSSMKIVGLIGQTVHAIGAGVATTINRPELALDAVRMTRHQLPSEQLPADQNIEWYASSAVALAVFGGINGEDKHQAELNAPQLENVLQHDLQVVKEWESLFIELKLITYNPQV